MELTPWTLPRETYTMEATSWNLQLGHYLGEITPWKLPHGAYTMDVTWWNLPMEVT